ncbi:peptidoglycan-binding domain-containing protein [Mumia quercus]|uniref:peptidoglycan-binding domain-containing protein n=1 Tax=Mumia quercus TaxID=2976125 RepID=UPI0021CE1DF6|nr:peptidoglycan-binding domain-containing protein [Mumia quercus]
MDRDESRTMWVRARLLVVAAAAMLMTMLVGIGVTATATPAHAATPTCTEAVRKYSASGERMFIPVQYSTLSPTCVMKRGNRNNAVKYLQEVMRDTYDYNIAVDGDFGPATQSALISLQRRLGITADGVYGPQTRDAICWPLYYEPYACWWYDE